VKLLRFVALFAARNAKRNAPGKPGAFFVFLSFRGDAKHRTRNLEIPGSSLRDAPE